MLGSGVVVVIAEGTDSLAAATNVLRFFRNESCGKCVPCRVGSTKAHDLLTDTLRAGGELDEGRRGRLLELELTMRKTSICGLGQVALGPVVSVMDGSEVAPWRGHNRGSHRISEVRVTGREFFTAQSVSQALAGLRPSRRTGIETVPREAGPGRGRAHAGGARFGAAWLRRLTVDGTRARRRHLRRQRLPSGVTRPRRGGADGVPPPEIAVRLGTAVEIRTGKERRSPPMPTRWSWWSTPRSPCPA